MFYKIAKALITPIVYLLFNIKYEGTENIIQKGGYIICSNHRSLWDPILIAFGVKNRCLNFMAKKELFKNKLFGLLIGKLGAFPVDRGKGDTSAIKRAERIIKDGKILLIFPEGTRSKDGRILRAKSGVSYIAYHAKSDVIPVAICFEGKKIGFRKKITVCYGKPIKNEELHVSEENKHADTRAAVSKIMDRIVAMLNEHIKTPVVNPLAKEISDKNE